MPKGKECIRRISTIFVALFSFSAHSRMSIEFNCEQAVEFYNKTINGTGPLTEGQVSGLLDAPERCPSAGLKKPNLQSLQQRLKLHHTEEFNSALKAYDQDGVGNPSKIIELAKKAKVPDVKIAEMRQRLVNSEQKDCKDFDLRKKGVLPKARSQYDKWGGGVDSNWCYAFALATVLSTKLKADISAADIALTNMRFGKRHHISDSGGRGHTLPGGEFPEAFDLVKKYGYCDESHWKSDANEFGDIVKIYDRIDRNQRLHEEMDSDNFCHSVDDLVQKLAPSLKSTLGSVADLQRALSSKDSIIFDLADRACSPRAQLPDQMGIDKVDPGSTTATINRNLEEDQAVMLVGFNHVTTIIGSKWDPETMTCRYLIRDSIPDNNDRNSDFTKEDSHHYWVDRGSVLKGTKTGENLVYDVHSK